MTPDTYTIKEYMLPVSDGHTLYVQDWGNKDVRIPIIALHGGPGSHTKDSHKLKFDPTKQRVIFFDQRGCGQSLPYGSLEHNTTADLVEDIEQIRATVLHTDRVILTGGSWGACLALAYALTYPDHVFGMVLNGIYTGSERENNWVDQGNFRAFFPERWEHYLATVPKSHQNHPTQYHFDRILRGSEKEQKASGQIYESLEASLLRLDDTVIPLNPNDPTYDPTGVIMEVHYLAQNCFLPERYILDHAHTLTMPIWLVQGRYDFVCPPETAYELSKVLPKGQLLWSISGHYPERSMNDVMKALLLQMQLS